ncbi:AAA family ATPase [Klebsiella pneumoniae]|nr:AAA family ATPase [Klebsiella pneumoniae]MDS7714451.1 AAA family ATPase [Klebsiella pneumoniae]
MTKTVGMYGGKFAGVVHMGHVYCMTMASTMVDELHIIVSHDEDYERNVLFKDSKIPYVKPVQRVRWWTEITKDMPHVHVHEVYEENTGKLESWKAGSEGIKKAIGKPITHVFSSEHAYTDFFNVLYPEAEHVVIDANRDTYPVSATKLRTEGVYKNWELLPEVVRRYYVKKVVVVGTESCVDSETEFFNGKEWKKISKYDNDDVLQFNDDFTASLVKPIRYIKEKTDKLYQMSNSYGAWKQVMSSDHDVVYLTSKKKLAKKKFSDVMDSHFNNKHGFQGKILNSFKYDGDLELDENKLRLMIAISADGSLAREQWRIRVKKKRKIERIRMLIKAVGLDVDERIYSGENEKGFVNFYVPKEYGLREFPFEFINLSKKCKEIFIDELLKWDGYKNCYYSTIKHNIDIAQFIISSCDMKANIRVDEREDRNTCYRLEISSTKYSTVDVNKNNEHKRNEMFKEYKGHDGYKYCFTVDSGMLVLRRDNKIFITGNCGKSTLVKNLATLYNTNYVEEYGRTFYEELGGCEGVTLAEDYPLIAYKHKVMEHEGLKGANKLLFIDTEAIVTQYYLQAYLGQKDALLTRIANNQNYDLWIFLEPDVKWVDDGTRTFGEQSVREQNNSDLKYMLKYMGVEYITIKGNYNERLKGAIKNIENLLT